LIHQLNCGDRTSTSPICKTQDNASDARFGSDTPTQIATLSQRASVAHADAVSSELLNQELMPTSGLGVLKKTGSEWQSTNGPANAAGWLL
jgi:hypothetical protein